MAQAVRVGNRHPVVMFEIIANDQVALQAFYQHVFGWTFRTGSGGFSYIDFSHPPRATMGGIGQAKAGVPGFEPGHNFYLEVEHLETTIALAVEAGGRSYMPITKVDDYRFAMIADPEGNPIGLIEPFSAHRALHASEDMSL